MKHIFIYISIVVLASFGACTNEEELPQKEGGTPNGTPLTIKASVREAVIDSDYAPFAVGDEIYIYYGFQNLDNIFPWLQGKYTCKNADKNEVWAYDDKAADKSIYLEDIKSPNYGESYYFTALSLPIPKDDKSEFYIIKADQSKSTEGYAESDFRIARAVYTNNDWKSNITLHFRHVLSRLNVVLILPEGAVGQGYFPKPYEKDIISSAEILNRQIQYSVIFDQDKGDSEILEATVNTKGTVSTLKMHKVSDVGIPVTTPGGIKAACHTFSCILPGQQMLAKNGEALMVFKIGEKDYTYSPPDINTIIFKPEYITTLQLTVLSGMGNTELKLNKVMLEAWKTDKANMGDLIPPQQ